MSTRSMIVDEVSKKMIFCHCDGYPEGNGKTLVDYYNTNEKVAELMNLGYLSVLENDLVSCKTHKAKGRDWEDYRPREFPDEIMDIPGDIEYIYFWNGEYWRFSGDEKSGMNLVEYLATNKEG